MFGVVDSDTLLLHLSCRWKCLVWLIVIQIHILTAFTFVLQVEMFSVVDSDTDTYLNCFYICPEGGDVWCG